MILIYSPSTLGKFRVYRLYPERFREKKVRKEEKEMKRQMVQENQVVLMDTHS